MDSVCIAGFILVLCGDESLESVVPVLVAAVNSGAVLVRKVAVCAGEPLVILGDFGNRHVRAERLTAGCTVVTSELVAVDAGA